MAAGSLDPLVLTQAEMAAVYQDLLGPAGAGGNLLEDLALTPQALVEARARLVARGLLWADPDPAQPQTALAPDTRAWFATVTRPRMLCVLQCRRPGGGERRTCFSWTPAALVVNSLDTQGSHRLEPLPALEAIADRALAECGLEGRGVDLNLAPRRAASAAVDATALAQKATHRALFLMVADVGGRRQTSEALSWLVSDGQLWLILSGSGGNATLAGVGLPALRVLLNDRVARCAEAAAAE